MDTVEERMFRLQRGLGLKTKGDLAKRLGVSRTTLYNYEQDVHPIPADLEATIRELEGEFLKGALSAPFDGDGKSEVTSPFVKKGSSLAGAQVVMEPGTRYEGEKIRRIPIVSWAHAGEAEVYEEIAPDWQVTVPTDCKDANAFAVSIEGDSMEPRFREGAVLVLMPGEEAYSGCYVVARFANDGVTFRRFERKGEKVVLIPLNERYQVSEHDLEEFAWIYPVWGGWSQLWKG